MTEEDLHKTKLTVLARNEYRLNLTSLSFFYKSDRIFSEIMNNDTEYRYMCTKCVPVGVFSFYLIKILHNHLYNNRYIFKRS